MLLCYYVYYVRGSNGSVLNRNPIGNHSLTLVLLWYCLILSMLHTEIIIFCTLVSNNWFIFWKRMVAIEIDTKNSLLAVVTGDLRLIRTA